MPDVEAPLRVLRTTFGFQEFRGQQAEVVRTVVGGGDALVLMPTGAGKSLCYQVPALVRPGTGIVVSPLIALMHDQVAALAARGVRAAAWNSSLDTDERREVARAYAAGELDLLYLSPERLAAPGTLDLLARAPISVIAIDEAHCVASWGHDFRPDYLTIARLTERFADVPRIALTATATPTTAAEIAERLGLRLGPDGAGRFVSSFDRPTIEYRIVPKGPDPRRQLLDVLRTEHAGDSGIVYCLTRRSVEETARYLTAHGVEAVPYHAGMPAQRRTAHQQRFLREPSLVVVATIAFGMGIDKPDVRFVAHLDLPKSVEGYYQETGRAGRDGDPATAWLAYGLADVAQLRRFIARSPGGVVQRRVQGANLDAMLALCETPRCRRHRLLAHFGEASPPRCGRCDACTAPPPAEDVTAAARQLLTVVADRGRHSQPTDVEQVLDALREAEVPEPEPGWPAVLRQLVAERHLSHDVRGRTGLRPTERGALVLGGEERVELRLDRPAPAATTPRAPRSPRAPRRRRARRTRATRRATGTRTTRTTSPSPTRDTLDAAARARYDAVDAWRRERAREVGLQPFFVLAERAVVALAERNPSRPDELADVPGIGPKTLARWGTEVLAVLARS